MTQIFLVDITVLASGACFACQKPSQHALEFTTTPSQNSARARMYCCSSSINFQSLKTKKNFTKLVFSLLSFAMFAKPRQNVVKNLATIFWPYLEKAMTPRDVKFV